MPCCTNVEPVRPPIDMSKQTDILKVIYKPYMSQYFHLIYNKTSCEMKSENSNRDKNDFGLPI